MKILIIDDERSIRNSLKEILADEGYDVEVAENGAQGCAMVEKEKYSVIFCDIKMPEMDGMEVLDRLAEMGVDAAVIMISGHGDIDTAVECIKKGAFDFIQKPLDLNRILITIKNATEKVSLVKETRILKKKVYGQEMVGESAPMKHIREMIDKVAPTDARVLIIGSNGTGKELVARNLHQRSNRSAAPYVEVNCAAIPSELIESELFGHEKGAFTSAIKQHKGKFEQADGGTLFLDEIGNLPYEIQVQLLRALQERKVKPVGSNSEIKVDVRIIAATNEDMDLALEQNAFREDLYHRINEFSIQVPTLSERKEDIALFANHFLDLANEELNKSVVGFEKETLDVFQNYSWPGNLRQMKNVVKRATLLAKGSLIGKDELPHELLSASERKAEPASGSLRDENHERILIVNALKSTNNNKTKAAVLLKIDRKTLYNKMKLYGLD